MRPSAKCIVLCTLLAFAPVTPSLACSMVYSPPSPPTQEEIDRQARQMVRDSVGVLEVITTSRVTLMAGSARILQVLKGEFRPGRIISVGAVGSAACGADMIPSGSRGVILVRESRGRISMWSFLQPHYIESMKRQGLVAPLKKDRGVTTGRGC